MERKIPWYDYITINIFYFAITARAQTLGLIVPLLVQNFVGEAVKGTALGNIRLWGLMTALLFQALAGILSDRSTSRLGRRRPFILIGAISETVVFILIGVIAATMEGMTGYWVLFAAYMLSMLASNTGHAAAQGLIPDLVPESKHGLFSGFKAFFELPAPLIFVSFVISKVVDDGQYWTGLLILSGVVLLCAAIAMFIKEKPIKQPPFKMDWKPVIRLLAMTGVFTLIILGIGELVELINKLAGNLSEVSSLIATAAAGVFGMMVAVGLGVWSSVRIGIGKKASGENPSYTWWVINRLSFLIGSSNLSVFAVYFLQERFAGQEGIVVSEMYGMLMLYVGLSIFISSVPAGWFADKFGKKPVCAFSGVLAMAGTVVVITSPSLPMLYIGGVIIGIGVGFFFTASWALGTGLVPKEEAGRYLGISNLAGAGAGAIGSYIGGPIGDGVGFTLLMGVFGFLFLVSALALFGIRDEKPESTGEIPATT